jgi:PIN domain nuclease of toxin-antitoxin system
MTYYVTDTHPLIWYMTKKFKKLPPKVNRLFDNAVEGRTAIWVPMVSLWELSLLEKAGKVQLLVPLEEYVQEEFFAKAIHLLELTAQDIVCSHGLNFSKDGFDTLIAAMTKRMECPLITADDTIARSKTCPIFWD